MKENKNSGGIALVWGYCVFGLLVGMGVYSNTGDLKMALVTGIAWPLLVIGSAVDWYVGII